MLPKSVVRTGINLLILAVVIIPVHELIAGTLFTEGYLSSDASSLFMYFILIVLIVLYAENLLWGFYFASMIAVANFFSIVPTWVYRIEGVIRIDDLALLITLFALWIKNKETTIRPEKFQVLVYVILGFVGFQFVYTVLFVGEGLWMALREMRAYVHYIWFFLPFFVFKESREVVHYLTVLVVGTVVNALVYIPQVLFGIDLGYVISHTIITMDGGTGWRVSQGIPDLLLPVLFFLFITIFIRQRNDVWYIAAFLVLILCTFLTHNRTLMMVIPVSIIIGIMLYMQVSFAHSLRTAAITVVAGIVFMFGIAAASTLLGIDNILFARFDMTRETFNDIVFGDGNLLVRMSLLMSVAQAVNETNPLLGLGFIGFGTEVARDIGVEYFGVFRIRTNDIGLATILGQGGWAFILMKFTVLTLISARVYRLGTSGSDETLRVVSIALICYIVAQIPISITSDGFASSQTIAVISIGLACTELLHRFREKAA